VTDALTNGRPQEGPLSGGTPWPKYHHLYLVLRQRIREGAFAQDGGFPTEQELTRDFGVSRITVRKALERLEREGAIDRQRGRGTFVTSRAPDALVSASLSGSIENLVAMGLRTQVEVVSFDYLPAPASVAAQMDLAPGAEVQRVVRIRRYEGRPFSHLTTHVPADIGRAYTEADMRETPLLLLLERAGVSIASGEQTITARLAEPEVARLLQIEPGEALLGITRLVRDQSGRCVELVTGNYRPDTYEHKMDIQRAEVDGRQVWRE
jgi:GntR family transcriptional regulator